MNEPFILPGSFRDSCGFIFLYEGALYRQVNLNYKENYDHFINSGLYEHLVASNLIVPHAEVNLDGCNNSNAYKIIKPQPIPFISYPYEWCFSQLKDAALTTLRIQQEALNFGMVLKDSSAYNIQFLNGKPLLIDTLSFEKYQEGKPWEAYKQFCQHFLVPLALMSYRDVRLNQLLRIYIDGIPLDLASSLLPMSAYLNFSLFSHIIIHEKFQKYYMNTPDHKRQAPNKMSRFHLLTLIDHMTNTIQRLSWHPSSHGWINYYENTNYSQDSLHHKKQIVENFLDQSAPKNLWDLGSNTGMFSCIANNKGIPTISFDSDPSVVEKNYLNLSKDGKTNILPLLLDLTNPSPAIGWENQERQSLIERAPTDMVLALALVHHLAISNNLPLSKIADFLKKICKWCIIEFIPKTDPQTQYLLSTRPEAFPDYTRENFEKSMTKHFTIQDTVKIKNTDRNLYLFKNNTC